MQLLNINQIKVQQINELQLLLTISDQQFIENKKNPKLQTKPDLGHGRHHHGSWGTISPHLTKVRGRRDQRK